MAKGKSGRIIWKPHLLYQPQPTRSRPNVDSELESITKIQFYEPFVPFDRNNQFNGR